MTRHFVRAALALACALPAQAGTLAHWSFDDPGQLGRDSSGNGRHAQVFGAVPDVGRPLLGGGTSGAARFDGLDDYLKLSGAPVLDGAQAFSLEAWIRVPAASAGLNVFRVRQPLALHAGAILVHHDAGSGPGWVTLGSGSSRPTDVWYHLAAVFERGELRLYVDGRLSNLALLPFESLEGATYTDWSIGARLVGALPDQFFAGLIDDLRIHDVALSAAQVLTRADDAAVSTPLIVNSFTGAAIQAALDAAAGSGRQVRLLSGTYLLDTPLRVPARVILRGPAAPQAPAVLRPAAGSGNQVSPVLFLNDVDEATLRDLRIDGAASSLGQTAPRSGILISGARRVLVDQVRIDDLGFTPQTPGGAHIRVDAYEPGQAPVVAGQPSVAGVPAARNVIENCTLSDPARRAEFGVRFKTDWEFLQPGGAYLGRIEENLVRANTLDGFALNSIEIGGPGTTDNLVRANTAQGVLVTAIEADKGAKRNRFFDNQVLDVGEPDVALIIAAMRDQGVVALGHWAEGNEFRGNIIDGVASAKWAGGIYLNGAVGGRFTGNVVRNVAAAQSAKAAAVLLKAGDPPGYDYTLNTLVNVPNLTATIP